MKNSTKAQPAAAEPAFDDTIAKSVTPRRHSDGRTISREQAAADGAVHCFSATGLYITTKQAPKKSTAAEPPAPPTAPYSTA